MLRAEMPTAALGVKAYLQLCEQTRATLMNLQIGSNSIETLENMCCGCRKPHAIDCVACEQQWHKKCQHDFAERFSRSSQARSRKGPASPTGSDASDNSDGEVSAHLALSQTLGLSDADAQVFQQHIERDSARALLCSWCNSVGFDI